MNINLYKNRYQSHPYHLVDPSPWPISTSFALLVVTVSAVMYMHGFAFGGYLLNLGTILIVTGVALWLRDVIVEGTAWSLFITQKPSYTLTQKDPNYPSSDQIGQAIIKFTKESKGYLNKDQFGYYLAGLLGGEVIFLYPL